MLLAQTSLVATPKADRFEEFETRAAFLFSMAKYTDWPGIEVSRGEPFLIGVVGESPMANALEKLATSPIHGRRVAVLRFRGPSEVRPCHILYFPSAEERFLPSMKDWLASQNVLTIGETSFFLGFGGALQLFSEDGRLRFVLNRAALDQSRLRVPAQVQRLAKHVIN